MSSVARKYIIIPEYAPLYAMRDCFGPTHGPLVKPNLTPVDIIGKLFKQSGNEKVTIFEVIKNPDGTFSTPVQLNPKNYRMSYQEIAGITEEELKDDKIEMKEVPDIITNDDAVSPVIINDSATISDSVEVIVEKDTDKEEVKKEEDANTVETEMKQEFDYGEAEQVKPKPVEEVKTENPYAGMSKAERRAARRREAEEKAAQYAAEIVNGNHPVNQ